MLVPLTVPTIALPRSPASASAKKTTTFPEAVSNTGAGLKVALEVNVTTDPNEIEVPETVPIFALPA